MTAGELRAILSSYPDDAPVLINAAYWPVDIGDYDHVIVSVEGGGMARALSLTPAQEDEDVDV